MKKGNIFTIELFRERLLSIMDEKHYNQTSLAEALDIDRKTVGYWLNGKKDKPIYPSLEKLFELSKVLDVSVDYLIGRDDYRHFGNKEISESTGLSEHSIELLRFLKSKSGKRDGMMSFGKNIDNYSWKNVEMINYIFDTNYERYMSRIEKNTPVPTILANMYEYIHSSTVEYAHRFNDVDELFGIVRRDKNLDYDKIEFWDGSSHTHITVTKPTKLYQAYIMEMIQKWLMNEADRQKKEDND